MRKLITLALLVLVALAMIVVFASPTQARSHHAHRAFITSGNAWDPWGNPCQGCAVFISDRNTGAKGSTVAYGTYSFGGMNLNHQYQTWIDTCKVHSRLVGPASPVFWGNAASFPQIYSNNGGAC